MAPSGGDTLPRMAWYWPNLDMLQRAKTAARVGACLCFGAAIFEALLVARSLYLSAATGTERSVADVLHSNARLTLPLLGCVLFTVAGWRIWNFSTTWAVIVLAWYVIQTIRTLGVLLALLLPPSLVVALILIIAARGTFAYQHLRQTHTEPALQQTSSPTKATRIHNSHSSLRTGLFS
jgi:hypothetical protein